jgi:hypothetical protein
MAGKWNPQLAQDSEGSTVTVECVRAEVEMNALSDVRHRAAAELASLFEDDDAMAFACHDRRGR